MICRSVKHVLDLRTATPVPCVRPLNVTTQMLTTSHSKHKMCKMEDCISVRYMRCYTKEKFTTLVISLCNAENPEIVKSEPFFDVMTPNACNQANRHSTRTIRLHSALLFGSKVHALCSVAASLLLPCLVLVVVLGVPRERLARG